MNTLLDASYKWEKPVTIADVAVAAGLSTATVSRALAQTPFARWAKDGGEPTNYASLNEFRAAEPTYETHAVVLTSDPLMASGALRAGVS